MAKAQQAIIWLTLASLIGCTTMRPLQDNSPTSIREHVEVGDKVEILATNGRTYLLTVTAVDSEAIHGKTESGKRYKIAYSAIESIKVTAHSRGKTGILIGATFTVLVVGFILWVAHSFEKAYGDN